MKIEKYFAALAMGLAVVACGPKDGATNEGDVDGAPHKLTAKEVAPTKAEADSTAYLLGVNIGMSFKQQGFDALDLKVLEKGIKDAIKAKGSPNDSTFADQFKYDPQVMNRVIPAYIEKKMKEKEIINEEKEVKFFEALDKKGVEKTASGLRYELIDKGGDLHPTLRDTVFVNYKLTNPDGEVLDESMGDEPARLMLGQVIEGFKEGVQLIGEGGKIKLYIPSAIGYGKGGGGIEPNLPLTFDVTLVRVGVAPAEEAKEAEDKK